MSFRVKLLAVMMLLVFGITGLGLYLAQQKLTVTAEQALVTEFQSEVAALFRVQQIHHATLAERCRLLAERPRIHAALEDNALDLLYLSAQDELRDLFGENDDRGKPSLHATFYRFLDSKGAVIKPKNAKDVGELSPDAESRLTLAALPSNPQTGYLLRNGNSEGDTIDEIVAMPIISSETNQPIAAIVVGAKPIELEQHSVVQNIKSGMWLDGQLHLAQLNSSERDSIGRELERATATPNRADKSLRIELDGTPHLLLYGQLNPNSVFEPAYQVCIYPLDNLLARKRRLRWQILGAGVCLLLGAFGVSHFASGRLSVPVTKLAHETAEARAERAQAQEALEKTSKELQRAARFSANTSHQLKTPVAVLRAGLEELRTHENLTSENREEIAALIHQTFRITSIIEDLLLLSQMDAGRLQITLGTVDLGHLIAAQMDDLTALSNEIEAEVVGACDEVQIAGDEHYVALIVQNLLENARKFNRSGGRIRISCAQERGWAILNIGNTGQTISRPVQEHIFERFHRGSVQGEIPGHGLGLNLARELARLHGGDLRLVRSENDWTEFEVRFRLAGDTADTAAGAPIRGRTA
jgi:signal transduction histidine kinase